MSHSMPATTFIVKDRARQRAKLKGKILMGTFYTYLDKMIAEAIDNACHVFEEKRNIDGVKYEEHLARIEKFSAK